MAKQDELSVVTQLMRVSITLRSQLRVVSDVLNYPSAAAKIRQMIDLCEQAQIDMSKYIKPHGEVIAHNTVVLPPPTIGSSVLEPKLNDFTIAFRTYREWHKAPNDAEWEKFMRHYDLLNDNERNYLFNELKFKVCNGNDPWAVDGKTEGG